MDIKISLIKDKYGFVDNMEREIMINGQKYYFDTYEQADYYLKNFLGISDITQNNNNDDGSSKICCICKKSIKENGIFVCKECHNRIKKELNTIINDGYNSSLVALGMIYNEFVGFNKGSNNND